MKVYKIVNGAERNTGPKGAVLSVTTTSGDKIFIGGIPLDAEISIYQPAYRGLFAPFKKLVSQLVDSKGSDL